MSGALLQILLQGEEDAHISSEGFESSRPFRQVYKRQTLFATELIDIDARFPTNITYGQTLSNIQIPRKGDLLRGVYIGFQVKRASGSTRYPAIELIDEVSLWCGKTLLERVRGDWIWVQKRSTETTDGLHCVRRLCEFSDEETQGTIKQMYVEVPFFTRKTPLPLIAMQLQNLHMEIKLANAPVSLDPTFQPVMDVLCEYCSVDDDERRFFAKNTHELLIERVQTQDDGFNMRKSLVEKVYTPITQSLGSYDTVLGGGVGETINLGDRLQLVGNPGWTGRTDVIWNQPPNAVRFDLRGRFLLPTTGTMGMGWAHTTEDPTTGYAIEFSVEDNLLTITFKRQGTVLCVISNDQISSLNAYTSVSGETTSTDFTTQQNTGEAWLVLSSCAHDLELDALTLVIVIEGFVSGGYFAELDPVNSMTLTYTIREGITAIQTVETPTAISAFADSLYDVYYVPNLTVQTVASIPTVSNLNPINVRYFFRGPIRYIVWWYKTSQGWEFGKTTSSVVESDNIRHDILHSARILINGKERCRMLPAQFFSTLEPKRLFDRALPAGVHAFGFSEGSVTNDISPNGTLNMSRVGDFTIQHTMRSFSDSQTNIILLDDSESLPTTSAFNTIMCCAVGYNVLYIENGRLSVAYM